MSAFSGAAFFAVFVVDVSVGGTLALAGASRGAR
jgi:hypothetical protein